MVGSRTSWLPGQSDHSPPHTVSDLISRDLELFALIILALLRTQRGLRRTLLRSDVQCAPGPTTHRLTMCERNPSNAHRFRGGYPRPPLWQTSEPLVRRRYRVAVRRGRYSVESVGHPLHAALAIYEIGEDVKHAQLILERV